MAGTEIVKSEIRGHMWPFTGYTDDEISAIKLAFVIIVLLFFTAFAMIQYFSLDKTSQTFSSDAAQLQAAIATLILSTITVFSLFNSDRVTKKNLELTMENTDLTRKSTELNAQNIQLTTRMLELQVEPKVIVKVAPEEDSPAIDITVTNIGNGIAKRVRFEFIKDIDLSEGHPLSQFIFFKDGIEYMPPQQSYQVPTVHLRSDGSQRGKLCFILIYYDVREKEYREEVKIDLDSIHPFYSF